LGIFLTPQPDFFLTNVLSDMRNGPSVMDRKLVRLQIKISILERQKKKLDLLIVIDVALALSFP
jgi:hypothetical protein